jgi:hypothetical protein
MVAFIAGCNPTTLSPIGEASGELEAITGEVDADEPWGECFDVSEPGDMPQPSSCSAGGSCYGLGQLVPEEELTWVVGCNHPCETAADCPTPLSGTAVAVCDHAGAPEVPGACWLTCDGGAACPDGFECIEGAELEGIGPKTGSESACMQVFVYDQSSLGAP